MTWLIGVQPPRPQAGRSVRDAHQGTCAEIAPRFVTLPPAFGDPVTTGVLIAGFAVHDRLVRPLGPHGRDPIGNMVAHVPGLTGLEVQPLGVLVLVVAVMRPVVDAGRLTVRVPGVDLVASGLHLWLGAGPITARQVDGWAGAEARHEIPAVVGVVRGRHHRAGNIEPFPAVSVEDRLQAGVMPWLIKTSMMLSKY